MKYSNNKKSKPKSWPVRALVTAVAIGLSITSVSVNSATNNKKIGDLEIYKAAEPGAATILMMLDVSGSMNESSFYNDYRQTCDNPKVIESEVMTAVVINEDSSKTEIIYQPEGCVMKNLRAEKGDDDYDVSAPRYNRMTRLKVALIEIFADELYKGVGAKKVKIANDKKASLPDNYEVGLAYYSYNGYAGVISVPTRKLTPAQRIELIEGAIALSRVSGTPLAHGYAEAGAYMMGTTTHLNEDDIKVTAEQNYPYGSRRYRACLSNNTTVSYNNIVQQQVLDCNKWGDWESSHPNRGDGNKVAIGDSEYTSGKVKKIYYYVSSESRDSGFIKSVPSAKKADLKSYQSPLNTYECSGNGIYLLTDGEPNSSSDDRAKAVMNTSLSGSGLSIEDSCRDESAGGLDSIRTSSGWSCMAEYSKLLRNPKSNSTRRPIKTATVGLGRTYDGMKGIKTIKIDNKEIDVVDCDSGSGNARNLCKLGERRGDNEEKTFGDGGFYFANESTDISNSILNFASALVQTINTAPSGTITIPEDPYRAANQLPYAYLPMLDPEVDSTSSIWRGNLKKYTLKEGTLFGQKDTLLYKNVAGKLDPDAADLWEAKKPDGSLSGISDQITTGGVYAQLRTPSSGTGSVRTVYVEDYTSATDTTPILRLLSVVDGKADGFDKLVDTVAYSESNKKRLLSFLGFDGLIYSNGGEISGDIESLTLTAPTDDIRVLGGVVHSTPTAVSYSSDLDANGRIIDPRDDYVLFGSMDGALHLVDADNGQEAFAIIPRKMLINQPEALVNNSTKNKVGQPYFGVDAPWLVTTDYKYDLLNDDGTAKEDQSVKVDTSTGKGMFAYGGLRMGGEAFYGMDISKKSDPKMLFTITPTEGLVSTTATKSSATGFGRIGQIWSKPTPAKIRLKKEDKEPTDVLVFAGGYDMGYEDDDYVPTTDDPAKGNAIYMINAKTGELLWSTSAKATDSKGSKNAPDMIHSITGGITVLDRDNDGLMDHLYAADLGGQVFRADFENARVEKYGFAEVASFSNKRVTRVLNAAPSADGYKKYAYRFYERPVVSFYRSEAGPNNGKIFALVNVISGNRSAPLSKLRNDNTYANRVYGIIDDDITHKDLNKTGFKLTLSDKTESDLVDLGAELPKIAAATEDSARKTLKTAAKAAMIAGTKRGWYYPLTRFDGYNNVRYNKGVGDSVVINNLLYTTVYNPDKQYGTVASCAAKISGGSERQLYCLPYGICMDDDSISGTGGFTPAGQGIQELTLGAYNADNTDVKVLIGTTTISERIKAANRAKYGEDGFKDDSNLKDLYSGEKNPATQVNGDGSAAEYLFNERYTLQPKAWYQQAQKEAVAPAADPEEGEGDGG